MVSYSEPVMGTVVTFDVRSGLPDQYVFDGIASVIEWLHWVDDTFSTYKADSEISRVDRGVLTLDECHPLVRTVLSRCDELRTSTGGYFDARIDGRLDPSGLVKGWSIERASAMLVQLRLYDHAIEAGGDVRLSGSPAPGARWQIAITHPLSNGNYCAAVEMDTGAVATSGTYRRGFHISDPFRSEPATDIVSATVIGPDLGMADAYATAAAAMGYEACAWLDQLPDHEAFLVDCAGAGWATEGFDRYRVA